MSCRCDSIVVIVDRVDKTEMILTVVMVDVVVGVFVLESFVVVVDIVDDVVDTIVSAVVV